MSWSGARTDTVGNWRTIRCGPLAAAAESARATETESAPAVESATAAAAAEPVGVTAPAPAVTSSATSDVSVGSARMRGLGPRIFLGTPRCPGAARVRPGLGLLLPDARQLHDHLDR